MKENPFANLKHLVAFWDETGRTEIIPTVEVYESQHGTMGIIREKHLCAEIPFVCCQDVKEGDILHNVEAFELKLRGSEGTTIWRLRIKSNQYDG